MSIALTALGGGNNQFWCRTGATGSNKVKCMKGALQSSCRFVTCTELAVSTAAARRERRWLYGIAQVSERAQRYGTLLSRTPRPASADLTSIQSLRTDPSFTRGNFPRSVHLLCFRLTCRLAPPGRPPQTNFWRL
jgi:hypothetical protein